MRYPPPLPKKDDKDLFWLAGLLEGEGSFMRPSPSDPKCPRVVMKSTDQDIVARVAKLFGVTYIHKRMPHKTNWKPSYTAQVKGKNAISLMEQMYPLMGERRRQQISDAIGEQPFTVLLDNTANSLCWLAGLLEGE